VYHNLKAILESSTSKVKLREEESIINPAIIDSAVINAVTLFASLLSVVFANAPVLRDSSQPKRKEVNKVATIAVRIPDTSTQKTLFFGSLSM
jgi:hypothetical protein